MKVLLLLASLLFWTLSSIADETPKFFTKVLTTADQQLEIFRKLPMPTEPSPEYPLARKSLLATLTHHESEFKKILNVFQRDQGFDYLMMEGQAQIPNNEKSVNGFRAHFETIRKLNEVKYHQAIKNFMFAGFDEALTLCLTEACRQQIKNDLAQWFELSAKVNQEVLFNNNLGKFSALSEEQIALSKEEAIADLSSEAPLMDTALSKEQCQNLKMDISTEDLKAFGIALIAKMGVPAIKAEIERQKNVLKTGTDEEILTLLDKDNKHNFFDCYLEKKKGNEVRVITKHRTEALRLDASIFYMKGLALKNLEEQILGTCHIDADNYSY